MTVGPTELDPWRVYTRVRDALEGGTELRASPDSLIGGRTKPSTLVHRKFRIEPQGGKISGRCSPGGEAMIRESLRVAIHHDLPPPAEGAYEVASRDLVQALRALLTRTELSGLGQPLIAGWVMRRTVGHIETDLDLVVQYDITLPEAAP